MPTIWYHYYIIMYYILLSCRYYYRTYYSFFILPLTRSLSDDPGFVCPGWRSELQYYQIVPWSHIGDSSLRLFIGILVIYFCYLIYPCFHFWYAHWPLSASILLLIYAGLIVDYIYSWYWGLAYIRESISALRIYVTITSPYPWDRALHYICMD